VTFPGAGAAVALGNGVAQQLGDSKLHAVGVFVADGAVHSIANEIAFLDLYRLVELQRFSVHKPQHHHRNWELVNAVHREAFTPIELNRLARLQHHGRDADSPLRIRSDLFELAT